MYWLPRPSLHAEAEAANAKRKAAHQEFLASQSSIAGAIGGIQSNYATEMGVLVGNVAAARLGMKQV
ncbi:MAG: hypothetical protein ABIO40_04470 [Devosia sp.]